MTRLGNNRLFCKSYRAGHNRSRNRIKRINRHLNRYGENDNCAIAALDKHKNSMRISMAISADTVTLLSK